MTRTLLLAVSMSFALAAHAQAVRAAPSTAPLIVQQPPSYPGTTYTPPGTGLPTPGQPGAQKDGVPRSPNKRLLPSTKEAGLWAADGAQASAGPPPSVFGVTLPYPDNASLTEMAVVATCHHTFAMAEHETQLSTYFASLSPEVRTCLAAKAYALCALGTQDGFNAAPDKASLPPDMPQALERVREHSLALVVHYCRGVSLEQAVVTAHRKVEKAWYKAAKQTRAPGESH